MSEVRTLNFVLVVDQIVCGAQIVAVENALYFFIFSESSLTFNVIVSALKACIISCHVH